MRVRGTGISVALNRGMTEVLEIRDIDELASYRLAWNSWLAGSPRAAFVNTFDWLETYWRHFGQDQQLRALVVRSAGTPIGVLPLCVRDQRYSLNTLRVLTYPLDGWGNWYGPIGSNPAATMLAAMQHIRQSRRDWDLIDLPSTAPPSRDGGRVSRSMRVVGLFSAQTRYETGSFVDFDGGWDAYLHAKPRKVRHEMRHELRRAFGDAEVETIRHRPRPAREGDGDPRWDLYAMCQQVALASWQAAEPANFTLVHERVRNFLRDAHEVAARNGMVDLNLLLVDGRPAAFAYNYQLHGQLTSVRFGFDASVDRRGLGTALALRMVEDSFRREDVSLDLGPGETLFQKRLRTRSEPVYRMSFVPLGSWRSQVVRLSNWAKRRSAAV